MSIERRNYSFVWKSLAKVWEVLRQSMHWQFEDGRKIKFRSDVWISDLGPLKEFCMVNESTFKKATVYAMTIAIGEWNWECFLGSFHSTS